MPECGYSEILGNNASFNNHSGIYLYYCWDSLLSGNTLSHNNYGVYLNTSNYNTIYFNNFVQNIEHLFLFNIYQYKLSNILNSSNQVLYTYNASEYTSVIGNYWDDYTGNDVNYDGIGDTPFIIGGDIDYYPLMEPIENYEIIEILEPEDSEPSTKIPGYNLFFLLGILSVAVILISKKLKKS